MTPKELLDTILGYLGFVVEIAEMQNEGGNLTLQIYTEESRRLIGRDGETLEAKRFRTDYANHFDAATAKEARSHADKVTSAGCAGDSEGVREQASARCRAHAL